MKLETYLKEVQQDQKLMNTEEFWIYFLTEWSVQNQFNPFTVNELFDKPENFSDHSDDFVFTTSFYSRGIKFYFMARDMSSSQDPNRYSILFYQEGATGDDLFGNSKSNSFVGTVIAGVFRSIRVLMDKYHVDSFLFNTEDNDLKRFYDKLIPIAKKRFPDFELAEKTTHGKHIQCIYRRKE
jgi:hypothetical protein